MGVTFHSLTMRNILLFSLVFLCFLSHLELKRIKTKVEETKPDCSSGWSAFNGNCYKHFSEKKTWEDAEDECVKEKAHLVSIHSAEEHQFVAGQGGGLLWLGGRRDSENREDWVWSDRAPWGYTNWAEGEPNNHLGRNEDCALIYPDFGKKWNDFPCSSETTFVCKKGSMEENNNHTVSWNGKCVRDSSRPFRLLPTNAVPGYDLGGPFPSNTPARCKEACDDQGFLFAGVQTGHECWCGNDAPPQDRIVDMRECNVSCSGDSTLKCGGIWRMNVYKIEGETNQVSCPSGWSVYNGNCYKFVSKAKSFSEAEGYCNSIWDAHLASIHSAGENQFIYDSYGGEAGGDIWIGGKRQGDSFAWLDGTPWDYQNWSPNNPSHRHEECAEIFALNYYPSNWNDDSCSSRNAFVCQLTPAKGTSRRQLRF